MSQQNTNTQPNVLVICIDQWDNHMDLPEGANLPTLNRLERDGVTLDKQYCTVPICTPSRATMWTGQHARKVGLWDNTNFAWIASGLSEDIPTIGDMMRDQGYYTAFKGKWHLSQVALSEDALEGYGFSDYQQWGDMFGAPLEGEVKDGTVAMHTVDFLENKTPTLDKPWFLISSLVNPHDIMYYLTDPEVESPDPSSPMANKSTTAQRLGFFEDYDIDLPANFEDDLSQQPDGVHAYKRAIADMYGEPPADREDLWKKRRNYLINAMRLVDMEIGKIIDALDRNNLWENTVVVFTSDHGEMNAAHKMHQKGAIHFEEAVNVNMTVIAPNAPKNVRTNNVGSHLDLAPTLLEFAGLSEDDIRQQYPQLRGRSMMPSIMQPQETGPRGSSEEPGDGALIISEMLNMYDTAWNATGVQQGLIDQPDDEKLSLLHEAGEKYGAPDFHKRHFFRAVIDGRYKMVRWFNAFEGESPTTLDDLYETSDISMHDLQDDPGEMENIGNPHHPGYNPELVKKMLLKLNQLIDQEVGESDVPFDVHMFGTEDVTYTV